MLGSAREIFVRSIKEMVYMIKATGTICRQRSEGMRSIVADAFVLPKRTYPRLGGSIKPECITIVVLT